MIILQCYMGECPSGPDDADVEIGAGVATTGLTKSGLVEYILCKLPFVRY